jgi:hypothetical protein
MPLSWDRALSWRLRAQLLEPIGRLVSVEDVVRRLGAIPAQSEAAAELAIRSRRGQSEPGEVARALAEGTIIKSFAFRGATHLLTPTDGADYLALRASSRMWELPSWQSFYGLTPADWPGLRAAVREALGDAAMTQEELAAAITARGEYRRLADALVDRSCTILKPFAWQGDICFAPSRDGRATFQRLDRNPRWAGLPNVDEAGPSAIVAYLRAYAPATPAHLQYWLGAGLGTGRKQIRSWLHDLGKRLAPIDIDGESALVLAEDLEELTTSEPASTIRLLPGHDQWVLGPGTADAHVVPPTRRTLVTRGANLVIAGGVVSGTWSVTKEGATVNWFSEVAPLPEESLAEQVARLAVLLGRTLQVTIRTID